MTFLSPRYESLAAKVHPDYREAWRKFIKNGEADEAFLDFLEADADCREVTNEAHNLQAEAFAEFGRILRETPPTDQPASTPNPDRCVLAMSRTEAACALAVIVALAMCIGFILGRMP